mmetsp:Transcript_112500/g.314369  ORF Transcript_112500/g.314369 Transcript_112500/m.314369 type:complete len:251 (-) Transcript_112500:117-869(-)
MRREALRSRRSQFIGVANGPESQELQLPPMCAFTRVGAEPFRRAGEAEEGVAADGGDIRCLDSSSLPSGGSSCAPSSGAMHGPPFVGEGAAVCVASPTSGVVTRDARTFPRMLRELRASMIFLSALVGVAKTAKGGAASPQPLEATSCGAPTGDIATRRNCIPDPVEGRESWLGVDGGSGCPGNGGDAGAIGTPPPRTAAWHGGAATDITGDGAALPRKEAVIMLMLLCRSGLSRFVGVAKAPTNMPPPD